jgi:hypothetical protein
VGVLLSLQSVAAPLDIERLSVLSIAGEPLKAVAVIRTESEEVIAPDCLSLGDESDLPFPDYPLLTNARIELSPAGDAIEISTVAPVTSPGLAVLLKVQCPGEPLTARHFNLLIRQSREPVQTQFTDTEPAYGRGTRLTVLRDETVASVARTIYPTQLAARRQLELAIIAANPDLFPRGQPVPLKAGTKIVVPDLRDARQLAASAARLRARPTPEAQRPATPTAAAPAVLAQPRLPQGESAGDAMRATAEPRPRLPKKLRLKLARAELNLKRSEGISEATRDELRRTYRGELAIVAAAGAEVLELKLAQLRASQSAINSQLARLEQAVEALRQSIAAIVSSAPPRPPPPRPAREPVAARKETQWMLWAAAAAGSLLLAAVAFLIGRRTGSVEPTDEYEARIDALLQQARAVAGPLLESEPQIPPAGPVARKPLPDIITAPEPPRAAPPPPPTPVAQHAEDAATAGESPADTRMPEPVTPLPQLPDFMLEGQPNAEAGVDLELEAGAEAAQERAQQVGVKTDLRREMDLALDSARSMFTDVDRFISLGRTQSATSLLEFQVQKDPTDRDAWLKLMAVYRQEGMEAEFQRTFAEFKKKFPGEV